MSEVEVFWWSSVCLALWGLGFVLTRLIPHKKTTNKYGYPYDMAGDLFETIAPVLLALGILGMLISGIIILSS